MPDIPESPFGRKLRGRREIAAYHLQDTSPQALRRISALLSEVREENRIPHSVDGDGEPVSFTGWLDAYQLARAKYLPALETVKGKEAPPLREVRRHATARDVSNIAGRRAAAADTATPPPAASSQP